MNFSKTLIDFIVDIAKSVFTTNDKQDSPYDVNFTNHYVELHNFEEKCGSITKNYLPIDKIVQDRKNKSLNVHINKNIDDKSLEQIRQYCSDNNIDIKINKNAIENITISKNTKGVLEERKWKKEMR